MSQKELRVVHILGTLSYGGLQLRVLDLIKELPSFSHVVVIQSEVKGPLYSRYESVSARQRRGNWRGQA